MLVAGLLTWVILLRSDLNSTSDRLHQARQEQSASVSVLASMATAIPLVADSSPNAYGTLYIGTNKDQALLVVEKLTPTPANRMYQVWLVNQSTRVSAGLFTVDQSGSATVMIKAPSPLSAYQSLGITSEPSPSGSSWPTGPRVIGCSLH